MDTVKRYAVVLFLASGLLPLLSGQKTRMGSLPKAKPGVEYPIKVHISGFSVRKACPALLNNEPCNELDVDAVIDGKKIGLRGVDVSYPSYRHFNVLPGDYHARLIKDPPMGAPPDVYREYELLLPGSVVWHCVLTRISE